MHIPRITGPKKPKRKKTGSKAGLPPGTLVHVGPKRTEKKTIELIQFDQHSITEEMHDNADDILSKVEENKVSWINID